MDIIGNLRRLESSLSRRIDEATQRVAPSNSREPLEIAHSIVDVIEKRIEPAGRGKHVFPFDQITIRIVAESAETRARFEAVLASPPNLHDRIIERIETFGCEWTGLTIGITYVDSVDPHSTSPHFHVQFERVAGLPQLPVRKPEGDTLKLVVARGVAEKPVYLFTSSCINLGRCPEVRDSNNRLIRTNHVVFEDDTVSRNHAHIGRTETQRDYRVYDDQSAHGTSIVRNGRSIDVPPGSRGVRLQTGDLLVLGNACLQADFGNFGEATTVERG